VTTGLRRFVGRSPVEFAQRVATPQGEVCELCSVGIGDEHPHVVNLERRNLLCTCRPCYLLFTPDGAGRGNFRAVPNRYLAADQALSQQQWDALQVPVGMAFFFRNSLLGRMVALYPGPAGATESLLDLHAWNDIASSTPLAAEMQDDVEALIVRRDRENDQRHGPETFLVPIDACYELVGLLRLHWTGFDGGPEARADIDAFFERVRARAHA
jgi:hypothetical protein